MTEEGIPALLLVDDSLTIIPPLGAGPFNASVPVAVVPPSTDAGIIVRLTGTIGTIVRDADVVVVPVVALIVASTVFATLTVAIAKVPDEVWAGTTTLAGGVALELLDDSLTTMPPFGATPVKVTVPVVGVPPATLVGARLSDAARGAEIVRTFEAELEPKFAFIVAEVDADTGVVVIVNDADEAPEAKVTVEGTTADKLLDLIATVTPLFPAAEVSVIVPVEDFPPTTEVGPKVSDFIDWAVAKLNQATSPRTQMLLRNMRLIRGSTRFTASQPS